MQNGIKIPVQQKNLMIITVGTYIKLTGSSKFSHRGKGVTHVDKEEQNEMASKSRVVKAIQTQKEGNVYLLLPAATSLTEIWGPNP